jgi:hypothetical protein
VLVAILAGSAAVRAYLFAGFIGLDDAEYARFAYQMAHGAFHFADYTGPAVFPLRLGVIVPTALAIRLFGLTEWATVLYPFLLSLCGIVVAYVCATHLFGRAAGVIAAGLTGVFPWDIDSATRLVPDLPAAFFAGAAVTATMLLERHVMQRRAVLFLGGVAAGLGFGLSWLCKESVAYLVPFCAVWMILGVRTQGPRILVLWAGIAAGSMAVLLGEMITYHFVAGDLLFRLHEMERNYRQWENSFFTAGSDFGWKEGETYRHALVHRLLVSGPRMIFLNRSFLFLPLLGLLVAMYAWFRRDRSLRLPAIWLLSLAVMFNFASSSTTSYLPLALFERYLFPIFLPTILLVSGFIAKMVFVDHQMPTTRHVPAFRWAGLAAAALIVWTGGIHLARSLRNPSTWLSEISPLTSWIRPETPAYADALSLRAFDFVYRYPSQTAWHELASVASPNDIPAGTLVIIAPSHIEWLDRNAGMWVSWPHAGPTDPSGYPARRFADPPPESWSLVWRKDEASLYRVEAASRNAAGSGGSVP